MSLEPFAETSDEPAGVPSPYVDLDRAAWSRLRENHPLSLSAEDVARIRGLGERLDLNEVERVSRFPRATTVPDGFLDPEAVPTEGPYDAAGGAAS